ncbi:MAG: VWA domain-containing protein [Melioribacteraceae bacterium]|nr:VWA domain-containing protein [Melioribacteraceae bacterium]
MVFLNPSILFGLLAASIPILIHLINLRKLQRVEFSTLAFLKELQKSKIKKIKIKQWILLLLRTLIIIFLVLAFARPTMESVTLAGSTAAAKSTAVFIIDNSFSMNYVGEEGSLFNKSKKMAKDIISEMNENDEFIIVYSKDSSSTMTGKSSAIKNLNNYNTTNKSEYILDQVLKAIDILNESDNINKEIYLFSDFQRSTFASQQIIDILDINSIDDKIKFYAFDLSVNEAANLSVSNLKLENAIVEINKNLTLSALISNYSPDQVNNVLASLFINDKRVAQQSINLGPGSNRRVKFETQLTDKGLNEVRVELEEDNIPEDNKAYFSFLVPEKIRVLILYEDEKDVYFVETALSSMTITDQIEYNSYNILNTPNFSFNDYNLIFLVSSELKGISGLSNYLTDGGKLLFIPPSGISKDKLESIKGSINLPAFENIITTSPNDGNYLEFGDIEVQHPILISLFEDTEQPKIESPNIYKYITFNEPEGINPIIRLIDDTIFLGEYKLGEGQVLYFNTSHILTWSNFPIKGIFAPLISRIVYYLATKTEIKNAHLAGDNIAIDISNTSFPIIEVGLPLGNDRISRDNNEQNKIIYENTNQLGNYKFSVDEKLIHHASVNINPAESDLTKIENELTEEIYSKLFGKNYLILFPGENYNDRITQARFGTELWSYFLIIALILALIEMFIARNTKKDILNFDIK